MTRADWCIILGALLMIIAGLLWIWQAAPKTGIAP
jgi:hypothetical protein